MAIKLTKSKFKLALECPTKLYYIDKPQYANQQKEDSFLKALAEGGYQVEALARCYYPDGVFVEANQQESALDVTKRLLQSDSIILFEAEIVYQQYLVRTDILIKHHDHLKLIEVKAKSMDKESIKEFEKKMEPSAQNGNPTLLTLLFKNGCLNRPIRITGYLAI